jgi:hypothetical protein
VGTLAAEAQRSVAQMTEIEANQKCLSRIVGEQLTAVMFVMDYLKFQFNDPVLTVLTSVLVRIGDGTYQLGDLPWRDSLCDRMTRTVSELLLTVDQLQIRFDDGSSFLVPLKDEARAGNEAMIFEYRNAPDPWQMLVMHIV